MVDNETVRQLKLIDYCALSTNRLIGDFELVRIVVNLGSHGHSMRPNATS